MKLLKKWWTGLHLTCRDCGQEFELEEQDAPRDGFLSGHPYFAGVKCPNCDEWVNVRVPYDARTPKANLG
jgi:hypothetical protein